MKLMSSRTSQRVPVGFDAASSSVATLAEADVRFVSGILAPVIFSALGTKKSTGPTTAPESTRCPRSEFYESEMTHPNQTLEGVNGS
jgi:hypothetical protein